MGSAEELKGMAERQELEAVERSSTKASAMIEDARRSHATCRSMVGKDPKSAVLLAWDGVAFTTLTGGAGPCRLSRNKPHGPPPGSCRRVTPSSRRACTHVTHRVIAANAGPRHVRDGSARRR